MHTTFCRRPRGVTTIEVATVALLLAIAVGVALPVALSSQTAGERGAAQVTLLAIETAFAETDVATWATGASGNDVAEAVASHGIVVSGDTSSNGPDDPSVSGWDDIDDRVFAVAAIADNRCLVLRFTPLTDAAGSFRRDPTQVAARWGEYAFDPDNAETCNPGLLTGIDGDDVLGSRDTPSDLTP